MRIASPELSGEGLRLRPLAARDATAYAGAFREDPDLGRLLGVERDPDAADVRRRASRNRRRAAAGLGLELAIADPADDAFAGSIALHSFDWHHRRCEVGFWLIPAARGRGLGPRAVALAVSWAFETLDLLRIEMTTTPDNLAVRALARRLGFAQEGVLRRRNIERGRRVDVVFFGVLREEWEAR